MLPKSKIFFYSGCCVCDGPWLFLDCHVGQISTARLDQVSVKYYIQEWTTLSDKIFRRTKFLTPSRNLTILSDFCLTFVLKYWTQFSTDKTFRRTKFSTPSWNFDTFVRRIFVREGIMFTNAILFIGYGFSKASTFWQTLDTYSIRWSLVENSACIPRVNKMLSSQIWQLDA